MWLIDLHQKKNNPHENQSEYCLLISSKNVSLCHRDFLAIAMCFSALTSYFDLVESGFI